MRDEEQTPEDGDLEDGGESGDRDERNEDPAEPRFVDWPNTKDPSGLSEPLKS